MLHLHILANSQQFTLFRLPARRICARSSAFRLCFDSRIGEHQRQILARDHSQGAAANRAVGALHERKAAREHGFVTDGLEEARAAFELLAPGFQMSSFAAFEAVRKGAYALGPRFDTVCHRPWTKRRRNFQESAPMRFGVAFQAMSKAFGRVVEALAHRREKVVGAWQGPCERKKM